MPGRSIARALSAALDFLAGAQLRHGEFATLASPDRDMVADCQFDSSPFATALVLHALDSVPDPRAGAMGARALSFLASETEGPGLWRYWSSRNPSHRQLPPDLDDTCCISHTLRLAGHPPLANREIILANRSEEGLFYTWLVPRAGMPPGLAEEIGRLAGVESLLPVLLAGRANDVDGAVNANVLLYLGESAETRAAAAWLVGLVAEDREGECSHFYADPLAFYYMLSRACAQGITALARARAPALDKLLVRGESGDSWGEPLAAALAACTLLNFDPRAPALRRATEHLLATQRPDGSWPRQPLFLGPAPYYGSEELTTALCVEALSRQG